jgi:hypothetical protein
MVVVALSINAVAFEEQLLPRDKSTSGRRSRVLGVAAGVGLPEMGTRRWLEMLRF